jgi:hypothetical protein
MARERVVGVARRVQVARDVARGMAEPARRGDEDVRVILADTDALVSLLVTPGAYATVSRACTISRCRRASSSVSPAARSARASTSSCGAVSGVELRK